ncbi:MAG: hypothetical protein DWQ01_07565 [Planctomycetota bacterium]|nr:MAG: hypothetical protein DWQ01_07565 [Planctomycetota bacterium]
MMRTFLLPVFLGLGLFGSEAVAQTQTATYVLDNVWLDPDQTHPWESPQQMTGTFEWTYTVGDFENGSGQFTELYIPWYGSDISGLTITIAPAEIEFDMIGNYHDRGLSMTLFLVTPFGPGQSADVDTVRSKFDIEQNSVSRKGSVISGTVEFDGGVGVQLTVGGACPNNVQLTVDGATASGSVALLYSTSQGSFVIPAGVACAGTTLGLAAPVEVGAMLTADAAGQAILNTSVPAGACGNFWLQALDITSCGTSNVALLQ